MLLCKTVADLAPFRNLISAVNTKNAHKELSKEPFIESIDNLKLSIILRNSDSSCLAVERQNDNDKKYSWTGNVDDWDHVLDLIDGLIENNRPGHQYLSQIPPGDANLVLSVGEYGGGDSDIGRVDLQGVVEAGGPG